MGKLRSRNSNISSQLFVLALTFSGVFFHIVICLPHRDMALWAWFVGILWHFTARWHVANPVTVLICCSLWCLKLSLVLPWIVSPKCSQSATVQMRIFLWDLLDLDSIFISNLLLLWVKGFTPDQADTSLLISQVGSRTLTLGLVSFVCSTSVEKALMFLLWKQYHFLVSDSQLWFFFTLIFQYSFLMDIWARREQTPVHIYQQLEVNLN